SSPASRAGTPPRGDRTARAAERHREPAGPRAPAGVPPDPEGSDMITLDLLLDRLPDLLVGEEAGKRLRMIGDHLPDALTGRVGLEARLHDDPRVDLLLLASALRHLEVLAGEDPTVRLGADLAALPAWQDAARLARRSLRLLRTGSPLPPAIWLEFDAGPSGAPPVPGLFTAAAPDPGVPQAARWDVPATVADVLGTAGDPALVPGLFAP